MGAIPIIGGLFKGLFKPPTPQIPALPPAANPPTLADPAIAQAGQITAQRARAAAGAGLDNTIRNKGGAKGVQVTGGDLAGKSLLG